MKAWVGPRVCLDIVDKGRSSVPAGNRTLISHSTSLQPSHYTNWNIPLPKITERTNFFSHSCLIHSDHCPSNCNIFLLIPCTRSGVLYYWGDCIKLLGVKFQKEQVKVVRTLDQNGSNKRGKENFCKSVKGRKMCEDPVWDGWTIQRMRWKLKMEARCKGMGNFCKGS